ncbi:MAG TPA: hypothetical protein VES73_06205, partial [Lamprocystis sp. (in: g-proteobacteria)]|nr:hypothetical protein [Lamprocystis sp. (in: g-proteobacteria)]
MSWRTVGFLSALGASPPRPRVVWDPNGSAGARRRLYSAPSTAIRHAAGTASRNEVQAMSAHGETRRRAFEAACTLAAEG